MSAQRGPSCQEALAKLERYLDGEMPQADVASLARHLDDCYPCADRAEFEEQLRGLVRRVCSPETPPTTLYVRIRARLDAVVQSD